MIMRNLSLILFSILLIAACKQEDRFDSQGVLSLNSSYNEETIVATRSGLSEEEQETLKNNSKVRIYKGGKLILKYMSWSEMPSEIFLPEGNDYTARVSTGDSVIASFTDKTYEGNEPFTITKGSKSDVIVKSKIINTLVDVVFSPKWSEKATDLVATVSVDAENGSLEFVNSEELKTGYFICPSGKEYLNYTLKGTSVNGKPFSVTDVLRDAEGNQIMINPSTKYTITFNPNKDGDPGENNVGGGFFEIVVDETPLDTVEKEISIYRKPHITATNNGESIDIEEPLVLFSGVSISPVFTIKGSTPLSAATLNCSRFTEIGLKENFDLFNQDDISLLSQKGITAGFTNSSNGDLTINFGTALNTLLSDEGEVNIVFNATDTYSTIQPEAGNKTMTKEFKIIVNNMTVEPLDVPRYDMWAKKVKLHGQVIEGRNVGEDAGFMYRVKKEATQDVPNEWIKIQTTPQEDGQYRYELTGLTPATTYEFTMYDGDKVNETIKEFTTEEAAQLPNAGFEEWHQNGKTWYVYNQGGQMFWDSGNKGATTGIAGAFGSSMTTPDEELFHNGKSAKLRSSKVAGILAAGNLFIGEFLNTEGTNGILGWGRPWNSRPKAIKGYVKYVPVGVDNARIDDGDDDGSIYIAIGDWNGAEYNNYNWPVIIRTADPEGSLFNPNRGTYTGDGIIGYGEMVFKKVYQGENGEMREFEIPIKYRSLERLPKSIIVVAAASKYGDYFVGGDGSTMWLDELELVYGDVELDDSYTLK